MAPFIALCSGMTLSISSALLLEGVLLLNSLVGWHRMPLFKEINRWLQIRFTTSPPNKSQLEVAKSALDAVLAAGRN
ncbi:hypothetical protein COY93_00535 [Candidatus Uhrbacteria bacterium CG_4_10_14_0_8_um_filter_58_22]|uniref:Uncharacterized protein n=1 Tax=Candidatus Uhrbacteria bacterium CG_4_10_14_0_8_um_filter_58_22 TaxID=1975029 RepID=A0A2M7QAW5_9BACT|nr:MAG: hypothetical protein AUJ19_04085 [Parcubacteria group bacterium CG1_02_58_44]PIY63274.1 MAG: hypothetical protein COY93_00535 [Candidatus Uhrbacteria bacterium CG_4_10_14_0_8_um_filter_58_22]